MGRDEKNTQETLTPAQIDEQFAAVDRAYGRAMESRRVYLEAKAQYTKDADELSKLTAAASQVAA